MLLMLAPDGTHFVRLHVACIAALDRRPRAAAAVMCGNAAANVQNSRMQPVSPHAFVSLRAA